jgi:hypothetical protein
LQHNHLISRSILLYGGAVASPGFGAMQMNNIETLLTRLDGVKQTGNNKWLAKCPAHDDRNASFGIKQIDDGRILLNCFAGCDKELILGAIGLTFSDLFPPKPKDFDYSKPKSKPPKFSAYELVKIAVFESTVISLAITQLMTIGTISPNDLNRVNTALITLDAIRSEVNYGR